MEHRNSPSDLLSALDDCPIPPFATQVGCATASRMTTTEKFDVAVVGAGIVGLATAVALTDRWPQLRVVVLEKEDSLGAHQTGRNSGVVHSGIYYKPGSFKARLCRAGNESIVRFCGEHGVAYERCGKLIVAVRRGRARGSSATCRHGRRPATFPLPS